MMGHQIRGFDVSQSEDGTKIPKIDLQRCYQTQTEHFIDRIPYVISFYYLVEHLHKNF